MVDSIFQFAIHLSCAIVRSVVGPEITIETEWKIENVSTEVPFIRFDAVIDFVVRTRTFVATPHQPVRLAFGMRFISFECGCSPYPALTMWILLCGARVWT